MKITYISEHIYYFLLFTLISIYCIINGYAVIITNDDWGLYGMLKNSGTYETFIMSYPLSYLISNLYDYFPSFQWYSILLSVIIGIHFYIISIYIEKTPSILQKILLLIFSIIWLVFLLFNLSITTLTIVAIISAIILIKINMFYSLILLFIAFLLRSNIMFIFIPFYLVSYIILHKTIVLKRKEFFTFLAIIVFIGETLFIQKQDKQYQEWLKFNQARSAIVDSGVLTVDKNKYFTPQEQICINFSWFQDAKLLPSERLIAATPSLSYIIFQKMKKSNLSLLIKNYKFKYFLWLFLGGSLLLILLIKNIRIALFILFLTVGSILLLLVRDVERVTIPLMVLWFYVLYESYKPYKNLQILFLFLSTSIFYYYQSVQFRHNYYKEITKLQQEAQQLIKSSKKACEVAIIFPTKFTNELNTIFSFNYLFDEKDWLPINDKSILPNGWLSRHKFFYETHHISDKYTQRKFKDFHDFLIDKNSAFFGGKQLNRTTIKYILHLYDKLYLKNKPNCKHKAIILNKSQHFSISKIEIECKKNTQK